MSNAQAVLPRGTYLDRAVILYHQGRYQLMADEVRKELADNPEDVESLGWLALALHFQSDSNTEEALATAEEAIRLAPDMPFPHYVRAVILFRAGRVGQAEAEAAVFEAMRLDTDNPKYFDLLAVIRLEQGRDGEALEAAEQGLAVNPWHVGCLQQRAIALGRLGRNEEADAAFRAALSAEPESPYAHLEYGRLLLRSDHPGQAQEHLREALRLDPNREDQVRPLLTEALRRKFRLHRWLRPGPVFIAVGAIFFALMVLVSGVTWRPYVMLVDFLPAGLTILLFGLVVFFAVDPLLNLLLSMNRSARMMLTDGDRRQCCWVCGSLLLAMILGTAWAFLDSDRVLFACVFCFFWVVPLRATTELWQCSLRRVAIAATALSVAGGLASQALLWLPPDEQSFQRFVPYAFAVMGLSFFFLFVPFLLVQSQEEFSAGRGKQRRAVVLFLLLQAFFLLVSVAAWFLLRLLPEGAWSTVQYIHFPAGLLFALTLMTQRGIIARIERVLGA